MKLILLPIFALASANAQSPSATVQHATFLVVSSTLQAPPAAKHVSMADLLLALAEVESNSNDNAIGRDGEVSRYQIMPVVWNQYGAGLNPRNPEQSRLVAERILSTRMKNFEKKIGRMPNLVETYGLWNKPTHAMNGRLRGTTLQRCKKFADFVNK